MKKIYIRVTAFALALCLLMPLSSCKRNDTAYITVGDSVITEKMYTYWLSYYKTRYYLTFEEYGLVSEDEYTPEFWDSCISGDVSVGQTTVDYVNSVVLEFAVCLHLFDELELEKLYSDKQIQDSVDQFITEDISAVGSRSELNRQLGLIGVNISVLKDVYTAEAKCMLVEEYLFGEKGKHALTDEYRESFYLENYNRVKHVLVDMQDKYLTDENGNLIMDTYTGYYKTEPLTEEEKAEKTALARTLFNNASAGADFEELITKYGEDPGALKYKDGYFLNPSSPYEKSFLDAALEMKVGEVRLVESSVGLHIIKKYPLEAGMWAKEENKDLFTDLDSLAREKIKADHFAPYKESAVLADIQIGLKELPMLSRDFVTSGE